MSEPQIIPTADVILRPALERMYVLRPASFQFMNYRTGRYWHPFAGFRAQTARMLKGLADQVAKNRLKTAEGADLRDFVASEFDAVPDDSATFATGEVTLFRPPATAGTPGTVPAGQIFKRAARPTAFVPTTAASYETLRPVHFAIGQLVTEPVPIRATASGTASNQPITVLAPGEAPQTLVGTGMFDPTIVDAISPPFTAAGGVDRADDDYVRRFARAFTIGQYGPTTDAARLGALYATGVRNLLAYDIPGTGTLQLLAADKSWASSNRLSGAVQQTLYDGDLVGFGCKVVVGGVRNKVVTITANVVLRDLNYLSDTLEIDLAITKAVQAYLDERPDWNVWKTGALQAAIARAHDKIFNCSGLVMRDTGGIVVNEIATPDYTQEQFHFMLSSGAVKITYSGPS